MLTMMLAAAAAAGPVDYTRDDNWLCRPGRNDICASDLSMTRIDPDGSSHAVRAPQVRPTDIDCFYVYPTASLDPGNNSDLIPGDGEKGLTAAQFAPFRSVCRTFAPLYRQVTLTGLRKAIASNTLSD